MKSGFGRFTKFSEVVSSLKFGLTFRGEDQAVYLTETVVVEGAVAHAHQLGGTSIPLMPILKMIIDVFPQLSRDWRPHLAAWPHHSTAKTWTGPA
jgi:hypothetical protein